MSNESHAGLTLRSTVSSSAEHEDTGPPARDDVLKVEAAPVNPSDMGMLLGAADLATAARRDDRIPMLLASVPADRLSPIRGRLDRSMRVGGEGTGTVGPASKSRVRWMASGFDKNSWLAGHSCIVSPDPPSSSGRLLNLGNPSCIGSVASA
jgi:hypothetical protein